MFKSSAQKVFATPQLALLVSAHLSPSDSNETWYLLDEKRPSPLKAAFIRNLPHLRAIKSHYADASLLQLLTGGPATNPTTHCINLKRIEFGAFDYKHISLTQQHLATLLDRNRRLTHLTLPLEFATLGFGTKPAAVLVALSRLEKLQQLTIVSWEECDTRDMALLLQACLPLPNLTELFLDVDWQWSDYGAGSTSLLKRIIKDASTERFSQHPRASKIKSLRTPINRSEEVDPLPLLLLQSDLLDLETCGIPWFSEKTDPKEIERVVREHCPNLKHLTCPSYKYQWEYGMMSDAFLRGCSGIQTFSSELYFSDDVVSSLVSLHHKTLEVFELKEGYHVSSRDLQAVLTQCKHLKRFSVTDPDSRKSTISIDFADVAKGEWACMGLTHLSLILNRCPKEGGEWGRSESESESDEEEAENPVKASEMAAEAKRVYAQIGRLEKLEVLELDVDVSPDRGAYEGDYAWDLTFFRNKGCLRQLAGLKNLKRLSLKEDFWSKMRWREMEFMLKHWPLLSEIHLEGGPKDWWRQSHWYRLQEMRPELRLTPDPLKVHRNRFTTAEFMRQLEVMISARKGDDSK
ncbi:hypothetical protein EC968_009975 [Mortierella alpina]|nr:hypothetical protein EC968_009975 [Mortierella alpina]